MSKVWDITFSKIVLDHELDAFVGAIADGSDIDPIKERARWVQIKRLWMMVWMLIQTGIRLQELIDLRVQDMPSALGLDFIEVYKGKGKKSRNIPVSAEFAAIIEYYIKYVRPHTVPKHIGKHKRIGRLFYNDKKKRVKPRTFQRQIERIGKQAAIIKPISPHKFRHRFCTNALKKDGTNIYLVKEMMGHSSLAVTEKYLHLSVSVDGQVGEILNQMLQRVMASWTKNVVE